MPQMSPMNWMNLISFNFMVFFLMSMNMFFIWKTSYKSYKNKNTYKNMNTYKTMW